MQKWEYQISLSSPAFGDTMTSGLQTSATQDHLADFGEAGWELASTEASNSAGVEVCVFFWKRPCMGEQRLRTRLEPPTRKRPLP